MVCHHQLFDQYLVVLYDKFSFFSKELKGGQHATKIALKLHNYLMSTDTMRARVAELKTGWTEDEVDPSLSQSPTILTVKPLTVANNIQKLQAHNVTCMQASNMCPLFPGMAGYDRNFSANVEKLENLTPVLQDTNAELVSRPLLPLHRNNGPCSELIYYATAISYDKPLQHSRLSSYINDCSDVRFAAMVANLSSTNNSPLIYNRDFKQHWEQHWTFLGYEMGLSVAEISAYIALLYTSPWLVLLDSATSCSGRLSGSRPPHSLGHNVC